MCSRNPCKCSCQAYKAKTEKAVFEGPPGAFFVRWSRGGDKNGKPHRLMYLALPSSNGECVIDLPVYMQGEDKPQVGNNAAWLWNGSDESPTLMPSIMLYTYIRGQKVEAWHGYLTNGRLVSI